MTKRTVAGKPGKPTSESVVLDMRQMAFAKILAEIQKDKLVATKSRNFANVLRRTLSTSKQILRVRRGTYGAA